MLEVLLAADGARGVQRGAAGTGVGRERRPVHHHGAGHRDDVAAQARRAGGDRHGGGRRLPGRPCRRPGCRAADRGPSADHPGGRVTAPGRRVCGSRLTLLSTALLALVGGAAAGVGLSAGRPGGGRAAAVPAGTPVRGQRRGHRRAAVAGGQVVRAGPADGAAGRADRVSWCETVLGGGLSSWVLIGRTLRPAADADQGGPGAVGVIARPADRAGRARATRSPILADTFDEMLARLQAAFEAERRFVANASHELRTPLAVIRTEVDVTLADPGRQRRRPPPDGGDGPGGAPTGPIGCCPSLLVLARTQSQGLSEVQSGGSRRRCPGRRCAAVDGGTARQGPRGDGGRPTPRCPGTRRCWSGWSATWWRMRCGTTCPAGGSGSGSGPRSPPGPAEVDGGVIGGADRSRLGGAVVRTVPAGRT